MTHQIYILAGQSNARAMRDSFARELEARHDASGFTLVDVSAPGAPLTYKRADADWATPAELTQSLIAETRAALHSRPGSEITGLIWIQGEADTYAIARSDTYQTRLSDLLEGWRDAIAETEEGRASGVETAFVALAQLSSHATGGMARDKWADVIAQQRAFAANDPRTIAIDPDALAATLGVSPDTMFSDGLHYGPGFQPDFAEALIDALHAVGARPGQTTGTDQDDMLPGTPAGDLLQGGLGDDTYVFNHPGDRIVEAAGAGTDTLIALRDVVLQTIGAHLEDVTLSGVADLSVTGNSHSNQITGNAGDNRIDAGAGSDLVFGGDGNDRLIDRQGGDRLAGGAGDDTYVLRGSGTRLTEQQDAGRDHVIATVSFTLRYHSQHIENLTLT
ncbi:MAG: sialate O-acetylesterase, partial [Tateyamaria sp.]